MLILDACHSGQINKIVGEGGKATTTSQQKSLENLEDKIYIKIYLEGELPAEFFRLQKHCIQLIEKFNSYSDFEIEYELINPSQSETKKQLAR